MTVINESNEQLLETLYKDSAYTIVGAGGDLSEWTDGYAKMLREQEIGFVKEWYLVKGKTVNEFFQLDENKLPDDLTILAFKLDGLNISKLSIFKLQMQDRWFDDFIDNLKH